MRQYSILKNEEGTVKAIKQGFTWPGWFFTWIWCLVKKLYIHAVAFLVLNILVGLFTSGYGIGYFAGHIVIMELVGFKGNKFLEEKLIKNGFEYIDTVSAKNSKSAISIFIENNVTQFDT